MAKNLRELPLMEQLAIEQALFSRLGEDVNTKNPDSLRCVADEQILDNYRAMGAKSYDVHVNGEKVGTYSVRVGKGKEARTEKRLVVRDQMALEHFISENLNHAIYNEEASYMELYAIAMAQNFAEFVLNTYGELPDGCEVVEDTIPAQPPKVMGTTLRIDAEKVSAAIATYLPTTLAGFIGGDDE